VDAPGQRGNRLVARRADDQPAFVADDAGRRPVRQRVVRHRHGLGQRGREIAEARTEHDADGGNLRHGRPNQVGGLLDLVVIFHSDLQ
jgi:hypothetical protein